MAAALPAVAGAASQAGAEVKEQLAKASDKIDKEGSLKFFSGFMKKWGTILLAAGAGMYVAGYFLRKTGAAADKDSSARLASIANVFGNVGASFQAGEDAAAYFAGLPKATLGTISMSGKVAFAFVTDDPAKLPTAVQAVDIVQLPASSNATLYLDNPDVPGSAPSQNSGGSRAHHGKDPGWGNSTGTDTTTGGTLRTFGALLSIQDTAGNYVTDRSGVLWNGTGLPSLTVDLPDGPTYKVTVQLYDISVPAVPVLLVTAEYNTAGINSEGIVLGFEIPPGTPTVLNLYTHANVTYVAGSTIPTFGAPPPPRDVTAAVPVLSPLFGIVAAAATTMDDIPKAIYAVGVNLPWLTADAATYAVGWGLGNLLQEAGPFFMLLGAAMGILGYLLGLFGDRLVPRIELHLNASTADTWNRFDKWFHTRAKVQAVWTQKSTEGMIWSANEEPKFIAPVQGTPEYEDSIRDLIPPSPQGKPEKGTLTPKKSRRPDETGPSDDGGSNTPAETSPPPPPPEGETPPPPASPEPKEPTGGPGESGQSPPEAPIPGGKSTEEVENHLGEVPNRAPTPEELERIRLESERNRAASMPPPPPPPPPAPVVDEKESRRRAARHRGEPSYDQIMRLASRAREVGYKEGAHTYQGGSQKRREKLATDIDRMEK